MTLGIHRSIAAIGRVREASAKQRDMCADQAGYGKPTVEEVRTPAHEAAIDRENDVYKHASDACKKVTLSRQTTGMSIAGRDGQLEAKAET